MLVFNQLVIVKYLYLKIALYNGITITATSTKLLAATVIKSFIKALTTNND
jgi:hypothetical protein